jgi:integrase
MPGIALTDRLIASLKPASRTVYFDTKARGLALRVTPNGTKTWAFVYRGHGKPQWLTLGSYPALMLADARALALDHRHAIDVEGRDPVAEQRAEREAAELPAPVPPAIPAVFTFADLAKVYEKFAKGRKKTWKDDVAKTNKYLLPAWGSMPPRDITRAHVHELLDTLVAKGMTIGVNRIQAVISRLFTVALDRSLVDAHPAVRMIKRFQERPSDRVLTDDELKALWKALDAQPGAASDAIRLRLLLGQRGQEVMGMKWSELDLKARSWDLPGVRTKNGRPHSVPLPPTAVKLLEERRAAAADEEERVFPGLTSWSDDHRALSSVHGGQYTWKDLRRTLSTRLAALGFSEEVVGRALNHARYTVTARHYIKHAYLSETRSALEAWDAELMAIVGGKRQAPSAVVPFRRSRSAQRRPPSPASP